VIEALFLCFQRGFNRGFEDVKMDKNRKKLSEKEDCLDLGKYSKK